MFPVFRPFRRPILRLLLTLLVAFKAFFVVIPSLIGIMKLASTTETLILLLHLVASNSFVAISVLSVGHWSRG